VFPNNWVSFHGDGTVVLYPMQAPNRREERRIEVLQAVEARLHFRRSRLVDLRAHEEQGHMLEGTGSLVLDHVHRIAYACRSARTDESLVRKWSELMNYDPLLFDALGADGTPIYHTNVLLSIGSSWAVVCADAIAESDRERVLRRLADSGREIIEISAQAMARFAGNILELQGLQTRALARVRCWCCRNRPARRCNSWITRPGSGSTIVSIRWSRRRSRPSKLWAAAVCAVCWPKCLKPNK
jgi:hypothetical protein